MYGNITKSRFNTESYIEEPAIWIPDLTVYQGGYKSIYEGLQMSRAQVSYDGVVYWSAVGVIVLNHEFDLHYYPFDTQHLQMQIESWAHTKEQIDIQPNSEEPIYTSGLQYMDDIEWELVALHADPTETNDPSGNYTSIAFEFVIKRDGSTLTIVVLVPGVAVCMLGMMYFLLPLGSGERIPFLSTIILSEIMFLVMMTQFMPLTKKPPRIVEVFFVNSLILTTNASLVALLEFFARRRQYHE